MATNYCITEDGKKEWAAKDGSGFLRCTTHLHHFEWELWDSSYDSVEGIDDIDAYAWLEQHGYSDDVPEWYDPEAYFEGPKKHQYDVSDGTGWSAIIEEYDMEDALERAEAMCSEGDWGDDGAAITVRVAELDEEGDEVTVETIDIEFEPNHWKLIERAAGYDKICGTDPDDHDWTSKGEGGCDQNPGVWSKGGTVMVYASHCRICGLHRTERHPGSQRNPGEHNTVEYRMLDAEEIARHQAIGTMELFDRGPHTPTERREA